MKILYSIQGTGNGHISRAREIIPYLQQYGQLDLLLSGTSQEVKIPYLIKYNKKGIGYTFGKNGNVDVIDSIKKLSPLNFFKDIYKLPVNDYDLVISDFEPITSWACKIHKKDCVSLSHQASFLSPKSPRPSKKNNVAELILKHYAPGSKHIGFHFNSYADFIHTPIIRSEIRKAPITNKGHITVYLPAYSDEIMIKNFTKIKDVEWHLFSKHSQKGYYSENVSVLPIHNEAFINSLCSSDGLITNGGFESPAEAMFLHKKVMAIPMLNQYEQLCNAEALKQMGVTVHRKIDENFEHHIKQWLSYACPVKVNYPNQLQAIIENILQDLLLPLPFAV